MSSQPVQTSSLKRTFEQWRNTLRNHWPAWAFSVDTPAEQQRIDMGNGYYLTPADLLEGHFHRLTTRTVTVQVGPDLQAAITVLAPDLAPLTEVASGVADTMPHVQPQAQFRADLHRALELTHRQHRAQRLLGTRSTSSAVKHTEWVWWGSALALLGLALVWGYRLRQRRILPA